MAAAAAKAGAGAETEAEVRVGAGVGGAGAGAGAGAGTASMCIVVRYRPWLSTGRMLREWLLVAESGGRWAWPTALPSRFAARADPAPLWYSRVVGAGEVTVTRVSSARHAVPHTRSRRDMGADGVWVVDDDFTAQGGIPALGVAPRAAVFGIGIAPATVVAWRAAVASGAVPSAEVTPLAVYHGTDASAVASIQRDGLVPAPGMLGVAVSVGTFWKAVRYASRTLAYEWRKQGAIVRAYLEPGRLAILDGTGAPCPCADCDAVRARAAAYARKAGLPPTYDWERTRVADHVGAWMASADTAYVPVVASSCGVKDGVPMYANKNAEYAVAKPCERLELQGVALLDMSSVAGPHWDPLQRNQRIM